MIRSYSEMLTFETFEERYEYLRLNSPVGEATFGFDRWVNQELYRSPEWKKFRDKVIIRDEGRDLGVQGFEITGKVLIHHINPITYDDIVNRRPCIFDMDNVITTTLATHNAIHYGDASLLVTKPIERRAGDTCPWK